MERGKARRSRGHARLAAIGKSAPHEHALKKRKVTVGSAADNDLVVSDPTVSRSHAIISRHFSRYRISDLNSTNGTFVNDRRVSGPTPIAKGDEIRFGTARFVFLSAAGAEKREARRTALRNALVMLLLLIAAGFGLTEYLLNEITDAALRKAAYLEHQGGKPRGIVTPIALATPALKDVVVGPTKATASTSAASVAALAPPPPASPVPDWLERVNYWRTLAKVPPVTEDFGLIAGLTAHARYLVMNTNKLAGGAAMHTEDPKLPGFSAEGLAAAKHAPGAVIPPNGTASGARDIDLWIAVPLHRTAILDPNLMRIALGRYCEGSVCAAALSGDGRQNWRRSEERHFPEPVEFPPDGSTLPVAFRMFGGEWPNPLSSCPGYGPSAGEPIGLQFDNRFIPKLTAFTVTRNGTPVETCGIDLTNYTNANKFEEDYGRNCLKGDALVVLVPRFPLEPGARYSVTVTVQGESHPYPNWPNVDAPWTAFAGQTRTYAWSFLVGR